MATRTGRALRTLIWLSIFLVNGSYAGSLADQTSQNNTYLWIIGGLCTILFTVACFLLNRVVSRLELGDEKLVEHGERLTALEVGFDRCPKCNDGGVIPRRRSTDHHGKS